MNVDLELPYSSVCTVAKHTSGKVFVYREELREDVRLWLNKNAGPNLWAFIASTANPYAVFMLPDADTAMLMKLRWA